MQTKTPREGIKDEGRGTQNEVGKEISKKEEENERKERRNKSHNDPPSKGKKGGQNEEPNI